MSDSNPPKLERRFRLRTPPVLALLVLSRRGGRLCKMDGHTSLDRFQTHCKREMSDSALASVLVI
jgi:hypothetical protein